MRARFTLILALLKFIIIYFGNTTTALVRNMNQKQYNTIESYKDASANPCTDFYQYACGNWNTVHANKSYTDNFENVDYGINQQYERILGTRHKQQNLNNQHRFVHHVLTYYKSCTSLPEYLLVEYLSKIKTYEELIFPNIERNRRSARQFRARLRKSQSYDGESNGNANLSYWLKMLATLRKYGMNNIFITEYVLPKRNDSSQYIIELDRPILEEEYEPLERRNFGMLLAELNISNKRKMDSLWRPIHNFEKKILELHDIEDTIGYEEFSLKELYEKFPQFKQYFEIILDLVESKFDDNMQIGIANRAYMHALFELLSDYDDEFICHYIMLRFLWHLYNDGPTEFTNSGCIVNLREELPLAMSWLHEQYHPELLAETETIKRIFQSLRAHFAKILEANSNHFDRDVLQFLTKKLKHMQLKVGNLPRNKTIATLESIHRELILNENDFYGNHLNILRFLAERQHARLLQHSDKAIPQDSHNFYYLEDAGHGSTSSPYYLQRHNMVIVPLTVLHLPLYHPQWHDIFKYSLIGFLLAHEITHGFDDSGLDYDEKGNMRDDGFGELIKSNEIFDGHLECLLAKNPRIIDEKIADVSGLRWAYETYFGNITHKSIQQLPWSRMSQQQLFFRNFALFFCGDISSEEQLVNSTHGTYRSRLYDTVSQFDQFSSAYDCQTGTLMNPTQKCQLWR